MFRLVPFVFLVLMSSGLMANPMQPDRLQPAPVSTTNITPKPVATIRWPRLNSIVIIGDYRKAIFNNDLEIALGDTQAGYQLIQVEKDHVVLQRAGKRQRINLPTTGATIITPAVEE